jgi:hypothetical protein
MEKNGGNAGGDGGDGDEKGEIRMRIILTRT